MSWPARPTALPGHYCGFTNNGYGICFDVTADGRSFTNAHFALQTACQPDSRFLITITTRANVPIQPDLTFDYEVGSGDLAGSYIKGKLDTAGNAQGVVHVAASFTYFGTHYSCLFDTDWTARLGA